MNEFRLIEEDDETFSIVEVRPVQICICLDRASAERVLRLLQKDTGAEPAEGPRHLVSTTPTAWNPPKPLPDPEPADSEEYEGQPDALPAPLADPHPDAERAPARTSPPGAEYRTDWTDEELHEAFGRIEAGEKLSDVAATFGKSWKSLRGKWANRRHMNVAAGADADEDDREDCRLCGKPFRPTPERLDVCARCDEF